MSKTDAFLANAETLAILQAHPSWEVYQGLLRDLRTLALEELSNPKQSVEQLRYYQGMVAAYNEMLATPASLVLEAAAFVEEEEADSSATHMELRQLMGAGIDHDGAI